MKPCRAGADGDGVGRADVGWRRRVRRLRVRPEAEAGVRRTAVTASISASVMSGEERGIHGRAASSVWARARLRRMPSSGTVVRT